MIYKMRRSFSMVTCYPIKLRDEIYVKTWESLSYAKNMGKNTSKNLSCKCSQKRFDHAKKSATQELQTALKKRI